jgi:predicted DNA-binding antitoxin AbrB/MazE fold protein
LEPEPISGIVKNRRVECEPLELKEYGERVKIVIVSEKRFSTLMSCLSEMEEDLLKLKELDLDDTLKNIEDVRKKIEINLKELSYSEYLDE